LPPILVAARWQSALRRGKPVLDHTAPAFEHSRMRLLTAADFVPAAVPPALGDKEIHLWFFPHWQRRRDATTGPEVRALLGAYVGIAAEELCFTRGAHGKPELADAELQFNLSHTGDALLLGVSRDTALGVDLEARNRRTRNVAELAQRWFTADEAAVLSAQPETAQQAAFLRVWTCKEAVLKCAGTGIGAGLDRIEFELSAQAQVHGIRGDAGWQVLALEPDAAHLGALAWQRNQPLVRGFVMQAIAAAAQSG
jgi:4'-phosphopantetheinyl transferase